MRKPDLRVLALLVCLMFAVALVAGCAGGEKDPVTPPPAANGDTETPGDDEEVDLTDAEVTEPVKTLAEKEKIWFDELTAIVQQMDDLHDPLSVDSMLYANFIVGLNEIQPAFEELKASANQYLGEQNVAEAYKNDPLYIHGLAYGQEMRADVDEFFTGVFEGVVDETGKVKDLSKEEVMELYQKTIIENYNNHYRPLNNALTRVEEVK